MVFDLITFGLLFVGFIVLVAWISEILARITRIPNIVFHLLSALLFAPFVLFFGATFIDEHILELLISICLGIVVFEGGYSFNRCISTIESHLPGHHRKDCKLLPLRYLLSRILRLTVIAGIITAILMTLLFTYLAGFPPLLAAVAGTLCSITGPTVINPIFRELNIKEEVAETLQGEGDLNDAIFGIAAAAMFTAFTIEASGILTNLVLIVVFTVADLGIGIFIGVAIGGIGIIISKYARPWITIRLGLRFNHTVMITLDMLGLLCAALLSYGFAELFGVEAAIAAALVAGILLGQRHRFEKNEQTHRIKGETDDTQDLVEAEIHTFQLPLTHIAVTTIFILSITFTLPFLVDIVLQPHLVIFALIIVCLLMLIVRPVAILIATIKSPFSFREKLFMSFVAPRGVIISALSLFFAFVIAVSPSGGPNLAAIVLWYILVIVFITVLVQGGLAAWIAKRTGVIVSEPNDSSE